MVWRSDNDILQKSVNRADMQTVCENCAGFVWTWTPDGTGLVVADSPAHALAVLDLATLEQTVLVEERDYLLYQARFSPDGRWFSFQASGDVVDSQLFIIPYRPGSVVPREEWTQVTDGIGWYDKPRWSQDGNIMYFISDHDGFRCIYGRRLDPSTKKPVGERFDVRHFHRSRISMLNVSLGPLEVSVARNKIVFNLGERTGNIWMAELTGE